MSRTFVSCRSVRIAEGRPQLWGVTFEPHPRDHLILLLDPIDMLFLAFENVFEQVAREIPYWGDAKRFFAPAIRNPASMSATAGFLHCFLLGFHLNGLLRLLGRCFYRTRFGLCL